MKRLHIFGQRMWHHNAYLIGNRDGLEALRDAISSALSHDDKASPFHTLALAEVEPSDEETYTVAVILDHRDCENVETAYWDSNAVDVRGMEGRIDSGNSLVPNERYIMMVGAQHERELQASLKPKKTKGKKK